MPTDTSTSILLGGRNEEKAARDATNIALSSETARLRGSVSEKAPKIIGMCPICVLQIVVVGHGNDCPLGCTAREILLP